LGFPQKKELFWGVNVLARTPLEEWEEYGFSNIGKMVADSPGISSSPTSTWLAWTDGLKHLSIGRFINNATRILERALELPELPDSTCSITGAFYRAPSVVWNKGFIHLVYELPSKAAGKIFYVKINASSLETERTERLDSTTQPSFDPRIVAVNDSVFVVWEELSQEGVWQIRFRKSTNNGESFGQVQELSSSSVGAWHPDIAADSGLVAVVWEDYRDGNAEIYGALSLDEGNSWSPETRLTSSASFSGYPSIAGYNQTFYVAWQDYRDGNWEIYFKSFSPQKK
jgi:hypothetical protein